MGVTEVCVLIVAGMIAGAVNAVAGGGTLLTFPVLLSFGVPAVVANATSTVALVIGTGGSVVGFRKLLPVIKQWLWRFVPVSLAGGWLGSELLTRTSNDAFARFVPYLILFATLLFLVQGAVGKYAAAGAEGDERPMKVLPSVVFQFFVALYGGYFGAGIGILMLASLGFMGMRDIHEMNALKNVLGCLINVVAAIVFITAGEGLVDWARVGVMTVGAVTGYYLGAHFSQRIPRLMVRRMITGIGLLAFVVTLLG
ncbi:sulfite exporter TauE/SafE family protein [Sulfuriroseicoccus oceanibius]|uniref:Probable membrane transporter protein n=1 Tax=Sulfuriroseicoccus oceanibius TaxID=2707525 RepID=A0A6B3L565_9BACT|nr:sulfite exporter TauE/SafE family protein [Sulfuriroseicoccus oceanibius]QQL44341.1 sulfite exporter TauE/SafE family protein [Sulfuriroseicoccus oceanibius]